MPPSVDELIAALDDPDVNRRLAAATGLCEATPPPVQAIAALVARIDDEGRVYEQWTDWDGGVIGGTWRCVAERVLEALMRIGTPAFTAVVAAVEDGGPPPKLHRLVAGLPMDALCAAGRDVIARAHRFMLATVVTPSRDDDWLVHATYALAWAHDELSRGEDRIDVLGRRLGFPVGSTAQLAAQELGAVAVGDAARAATWLAELLLRDTRPCIFVQKAAAASLDKLGPVLDSPLASRLVEIAPTPAMFNCWPKLLPPVARYHHATRLLPWLLAWMRDDAPAMPIGKEHHANVRNAAATAIAILGDAARPLHDELAKIFAAGPTARRSLVLRALPDHSVLVSKLGSRWRSVLAGGDRKAIEDVLDAIHDVGAASAPLLDAILPFVDGSHGYRAATGTIGKLGEAARPAVAALIRALKDSKLRAWACISLGNLGPEIAADAIDPLEELAARGRAAGVPSWDAERALTRLRGEQP